jgi:hypothetical protein
VLPDDPRVADRRMSVARRDTTSRAGSDCAGFLASFEFAGLGAENFSPVESGRLVPPPDPAP